MEQTRLWIALVVAMMMLPFNCLATDHTVGGTSHWELGVNYSAWASGQTFVTGDKLVFTYAVGAHDVLEVNKTAYDSCATTNSLVNHTSGNDTISLNTTGTHNYICGIPTHCAQGMKLSITVGATSSSPAPVSSNGSATPPGSSATPPSSSATPPGSSATPPGSSIAATSYPMDGVVFVGASMVFGMIWL